MPLSSTPTTTSREPRVVFQATFGPDAPRLRVEQGAQRRQGRVVRRERATRSGSSARRNAPAGRRAGRGAAGRRRPAAASTTIVWSSTTCGFVAPASCAIASASAVGVPGSSPITRRLSATGALGSGVGAVGVVGGAVVDGVVVVVVLVDVVLVDVVDVDARGAAGASAVASAGTSTVATRPSAISETVSSDGRVRRSWWLRMQARGTSATWRLWDHAHYGTGTPNRASQWNRPSGRTRAPSGTGRRSRSLSLPTPSTCATRPSRGRVVPGQRKLR